MGFIHGSNSAFLIGAFDITAYVREVNPTDSVDEVDTSTMGNAFHNYIPGQISGHFAVNTLFDNPAGGSHTVLTSYLGTNQPCTLCNGGPTAGNGCAMLYGYVKTRSEPAKVKDVVQTIVDISGTPGIDNGWIMHTEQAETTTNATPPSHDFGALDTTSNGWIANLHVIALSGTGSPTLTVFVEDSADNVTFAALSPSSFSAVTAVGGLTITGTNSVRRYVRMRWTISGTTPSFTFLTAFAKRYL